MENTYCVYKHTNKINGKVYIGITMHQPELRWGKNGKNYKAQVFTKAIQKYGWNNFEHNILYTGLSEQDACQKEIELIALYKATDKRYGYNVALGGKDFGSFSKRKQVYQYTLNGEFVAEYSSLTQAALNIGINHAAIGSCCRKGINHSSHGYRWSYEYLGEQIEWELMQNHNFYQEVFCYDLEGNFIKYYESVTKAMNDTGIDSSLISGCYLGKTSNTKQYRWFRAFQGDKIEPLDYEINKNGCVHKARKNYNIKYKKVYQYDADGNYLKSFNCAKEIQEQCGYDFRLISHGCLHKAKHFGFYWSYKKYSNLLREE